MPPVDELRIEKSKRLLELEKLLAHHHRSLTAHRRDVAVLDEDYAVQHLEAAQWYLGVVLEHLTRAQMNVANPERKRAYLKETPQDDRSPVA